MDARCRTWCGAVPISPQGCCAAHIVWGAGAAAISLAGGASVGRTPLVGFLRGTHTGGVRLLSFCTCVFLDCVTCVKTDGVQKKRSDHQPFNSIRVCIPT